LSCERFQRAGTGTGEGDDTTTKEELRRLVDTLSDDAAAELLEYARWLQQESETLTDEERNLVLQGEEEIRRGDTVPWDELRRDLDL